ncbi:palmitoyltransferase swf1 [Actinomortierella ambigua]|uniref:Palmitoyltransferase n=1 Tax=Actinomortierella ambigua TaxID=1343610 RepID=A0A9P6QHI5_9FUNG|nr:palmitoyltransferase swf1 [Actinomortierella ambigua]
MASSVKHMFSSRTHSGSTWALVSLWALDTISFQKQVFHRTTNTFTYAAFFLASAIGPGQVDESNVDRALEIFPYDHLIFDPKICGTCKIQNPLKALLSGWINQCVGYNNHKYFVLFLYSAVQVCWYGSYLMYHIFTSRMYSSALYKFLKTTNNWHQMGIFGNYQLFLYQMQVDRSLGALGIFASLAGLVVFVFFIYNLYLIAIGMTTNESFKWEDIHEYVYRNELVVVMDRALAKQYKVERIEGKKPKNKDECLNNSLLRYELRDRRHPSHPQYIGKKTAPPSPQGQQGESSSTAPAPIPLESMGLVEHTVQSMKEIDNLYHEGVWTNFVKLVCTEDLNAPRFDMNEGGRGKKGKQRKTLQEKVTASKKKQK